MSAHLLLNLLIESGKTDESEDCSAFYYFFATSLINLLNNIGARMLNCVYHMAV